MKIHLRVLIVVASLLAGGATAQAQYYRNKPPLSPYLSLLQGGGSLTSNYYNLVRPEIDFNNSIQKLQQQTATNQQGITDLQAANLALITGHVSSFQTQGVYFQSFTGGPIGTSTATGGAAGGTKPFGATTNRAGANSARPPSTSAAPTGR